MELAEARVAAAEAAVDAAEAEHRSAESDHHAWQARAEALALALDEARSAAGTERLAGVRGVLGTLLDLVDVDPGWESAFEAAAGEALAAVVVDGVDAGRRALEALHGEQLSGAVLALGAAHSSPPLPSRGEPVRPHVRARRADVEPLLDALVGAAVVVQGGWVEAVDVSLAHPSAIVVTTSGDRFGVSGWRVGASGSGATGAALAEAEQRAEATASVAALSAVGLEAARAELVDARSAEQSLTRQLDENDSRLTAAGDRLQRVETERRDTSTEIEALQGHLAELTDRVAREAQRIEELELQLPELEAAESQLAESVRRMSDARTRLEAQASDVGSRRSDLEVRTVAVTERRLVLAGRLREVEARLEGAAAERAAAETRRLELDRTQIALDRLVALVASRSEVIEARLADFRERRRRQSEAARQVASTLDGLRRRRAGEERALTEQRERLQRSEIEKAETEMRVEAAVEALRRDLDCEPDIALAAECPELAEGVTAAARIRELERDLRIMGPINPLALEEFEALQERHEFLEKQLEDVKESRRELAKVIRAIDVEIVNVFAAAFADVATNFTALFSTLFPGGEGRLKLTDPDDLLGTGIEVEAKPSGKNVRKLSLLSGGERSLTALAYLFAVFRSRPSPFYVMDEVEAALDDVNLHRFLGLVAEFRNEAQLVIVSHQKRTMEAADCLYGVSMQPGGSSKVVSEKVSSS
jgi:chromosome segregation protein